ncbi:hypothetical protein [Chelativorans salis]|uniref:Type I secretion protein n=1 Tax=Chelativorans salis TaxID=2978478 RepID=A0ABT2LKN0_9HYPH|nr:hypothetical protein [Chelativorans sp. EGI FJ00035]MCT7374233.1 hypothetical protein [Chelativorans sp. EGI FJ00035]
MHMDRITEAIAHFIGLFEITVEEARLRDAYDEFRAKETGDPDLADLNATAIPFAAPFRFAGFEPDLAYRAPPPEWVVVHPWSYLSFVPPDITLPGAYEIATPIPFSLPVINYTSHKTILPAVETLGSFANYIKQDIGLSDNDYFGVGGHGLYFNPAPASNIHVMALTGAATTLMPILELEMPGSSAEAAGFMTTASELLDEFPEDPEGNAFVKKSETIEGTFENGVEVDEASKLEDYYTFDEEPEGAPSGNVQLTENGPVIEQSVEVETGGNTLLNNAVLQNYWTSSPVMAVVGDHIEINAIFQINAWCDNDYISSTVGGWIHDTSPTQAFNIAKFERFDSFGDDTSNGAMSFPKHWVIKEIDGDLMMMNWLEQFIFMMDNDVGILSSSGVTTRVYSGDNKAFNDISIEEIGFGYDLIIVGGNVFDANIIHQLNVLSDNDIVGTVGGFQTTGDGSISTSGNLLWNQAHIYNVGGADRFETMPAHYLDAAKNLAAGNNHLNGEVLSDSAFAGYGALRVLHIKGDLVNLQYIKQTNILGDSDQLALAMHAKDAYPDAAWSVSTGGNALLNNAAIQDLDSVGKTYVGGGHYSNEVLVQADIISTEPDFGGQDPNVLVNEAVAFLDDDMMDNRDQPQGDHGQYDADYLQSDGLSTMIG